MLTERVVRNVWLWEDKTRYEIVLISKRNRTNWRTLEDWHEDWLGKRLRWKNQVLQLLSVRRLQCEQYLARYWHRKIRATSSQGHTKSIALESLTPMNHFPLKKIWKLNEFLLHNKGLKDHIKMGGRGRDTVSSKIPLSVQQHSREEAH